MSSYSRSCQLKELDQQVLADLKDQFHAADRDHSGALSLDEFVVAIRAVLKDQVSQVAAAVQLTATLARHWIERL